MIDKTQERTRLEQILAEWDLDNQDADHEPVTCSVTNSINLGGLNANVSLTSPYTVTGAIGTTVNANFPNSIWTTTGTTTAPWLKSNSAGARIQLDGESADITVNGWSLVAAVKRIEERLDLFQPNPELEKEWSDLRALGEQYRRLEQHIRDKQATFDRLKAMPAPDID